MVDECTEQMTAELRIKEQSRQSLPTTPQNRREKPNIGKSLKALRHTYPPRLANMPDDSDLPLTTFATLAHDSYFQDVVRGSIGTLAHPHEPLRPGNQQAPLSANDMDPNTDADADARNGDYESHPSLSFTDTPSPCPAACL